MVSDLYPFESHYITIEGHRCHYLDEGTGDPIVMLHGNPTWSFYYRNLILGLRDSYRVVVPDHIGCGLSDKPPLADYPYTLERRVADLTTLMDHLNLNQKVTFVLHDWGGMIGMTYAHKHIDSIRRVVLLNTAAFRLPTTKKLPWSLWLVRNTWLGKYLVLRLNAFCRGALRHCVVRPLPADVRKEYLRPYGTPDHRVAVLQFVRDIPLSPTDPSYSIVEEVEKDLAKFADIPTLICWGEKDFVFDNSFLEVWQSKLPHAQVHSFPDAGHYVLEDKPAEILALVKEFLAKRTQSDG
ncbi:MAG: alpha/beta fold hydrolase [Gemmataceae bacterium]